MRKRWIAAPFVCAALPALLTGCRIVKVGVITVAALVGFTGYVVYKTGDAAVTGVGKAGAAVASGTKSVATTVIYANGELKTEHPFDVRTVWMASGLALREAGFDEIKGSFDALSAEQSAKTREGVSITLKMRFVPEKGTEVRIRVGVKGDLKTAEWVDGLIRRKLPATEPVRPATAPVQEEKR